LEAGAIHKLKSPSIERLVTPLTPSSKPHRRRCCWPAISASPLPVSAPSGDPPRRATADKDVRFSQLDEFAPNRGNRATKSAFSETNANRRSIDQPGSAIVADPVLARTDWRGKRSVGLLADIGTPPLLIA
jgi:hypothetical protein